jgi:spore coat protein U-like protein
MFKFVQRLLPIASAAGLLFAAASASAAATTVNGSVTVQTTLTAACEVSAAGAKIDFGPVVALESTGDKAGDSSEGFQVACSTGLSPQIYSTSDRVMTSGANNLAFDLCLSACNGSNALATTQLGADTLTIIQDGSLKPVTLHGRIKAANFKSLPAGSYTTTVTVSVDY